MLLTLLYLVGLALINWFGDPGALIANVNAEFGTEMTGYAMFTVGFYLVLMLDINLAKGSD